MGTGKQVWRGIWVAYSPNTATSTDDGEARRPVEEGDAKRARHE